MDTSERAVCYLLAARRRGLFIAPPTVCLGRHGNAPSLPATWGGVCEPKKPSICFEGAVRDLCVMRKSEREKEEEERERGVTHLYETNI